MRISDAAIQVGVPTHVLRHWEAEGVVVPDRTPVGHRDYTPEHLQRLLVVRACQSAGLSLAEIRRVLHRSEQDREQVLRQRIDAIGEQRRSLQDAENFLRHVIGCRHDLMTRCPDCSRFGRPVTGERGDHGDAPSSRRGGRP